MIKKLIESTVYSPNVLEPEMLTFKFGSSYGGVRFHFDVSSRGRGDITSWEGRFLL